MTTRRRIPFRTAAATLGLVIAAGPAGAMEVTVDPALTAQRVLGVGAQVWAGDGVGQSVLSDLNLGFARVQSGVNWFSFPQQPPTDSNDTPGDNFDALFDHVAANFNGPGGSEPWHLPAIRSTAQHAAANGVKLILNEFQIAHSFLNRRNTAMVGSRVDDYATFLAAQVKFLDQQGLRPAYLELANEPNGEWNGFISPAQYNTLVQQTRAQLDAHGFGDVGILGPGLSEIGGTRQWGGFAVTDWVTSLEPAAVDALAGYSAHTWDDWAGLSQRVDLFTGAIESVDPGTDKPIFITEFATAINTFGGVDFGSSDAGGLAPEQSEFAVRVMDNTLTLINGGASALVLWEAADQPWNVATWGLRRGDGTERPTFVAMETLLTAMPQDARAVAGLGDDGPVNTAAVVGDGRLVVALANTSDAQQQRTVRLAGLGAAELVEAVLFAGGQAAAVPVSFGDGVVALTLPAQSTWTLVFDLPVVVGDLSGDGFVGAADLDVLLSRWNQSAAGDPADLSGDGFVGAGDLDVLLANWNAGATPSAAVTVPEPGAGLLVLAGVGLLGRRRPWG